MSVALTHEPIRELLARAPAALFGAIATEAIGRAERAIETAAPGEPLQHAVSRMWWRKMGALPVVEGGRLLGALTEDDLFHTIADRLRERGEAAEDLVLWETLLAGASVRDVMTPASDAAVVPAGTPLGQGLEATFGPTPGQRRRKSYVFVVDAGGAPVRVISFRDIARYLMRLYDGELSPALFERPEHFEAAQRMAWRVLDLSLGTLRDEESLGSAPEPLGDDASGVETIDRMAARARGYAVVTTRSAGRTGGLLRGICTRRDLLRALKNPFVRVDGLRAARIMTEPVKTVSAIDTLCGLFKMMAIEGFRHMPLVDESDEVECVISMWQGVGLLAHRQPAVP